MKYLTPKYIFYGTLAIIVAVVALMVGLRIDYYAAFMWLVRGW